ncbi:MAG TPA: pyridoxamine 5'-phosphate oxidase family protein [Ktedonobacterales bacterium]|nr:pyridoxamine 5'-phosphate oxidase family protein [Ktedonobacterales bacterium]
MIQMDAESKKTIETFLTEYDTLLIATERDHQPYTTGAFFAEELTDSGEFNLYFTFIVTSRKLANLIDNPRVGIFIGPRQPTIWLEGTGVAQVLEDEEAERAKQLVMNKSEMAAGFIARVPIKAVKVQVNWGRITDLRAGYAVTEVHATEEEVTA